MSHAWRTRAATTLILVLTMTRLAAADPVSVIDDMSAKMHAHAIREFSWDEASLMVYVQGLRQDLADRKVQKGFDSPRDVRDIILALDHLIDDYRADPELGGSDRARILNTCVLCRSEVAAVFTRLLPWGVPGAAEPGLLVVPEVANHHMAQTLTKASLVAPPPVAARIRTWLNTNLQLLETKRTAAWWSGNEPAQTQAWERAWSIAAFRGEKIATLTLAVRCGDDAIRRLVADGDGATASRYTLILADDAVVVGLNALVFSDHNGVIKLEQSTGRWPVLARPTTPEAKQPPGRSRFDLPLEGREGLICEYKTRDEAARSLKSATTEQRQQVDRWMVRMKAAIVAKDTTALGALLGGEDHFGHAESASGREFQTRFADTHRYTWNRLLGFASTWTMPERHDLLLRNGDCLTSDQKKHPRLALVLPDNQFFPGLNYLTLVLEPVSGAAFLEMYPDPLVEAPLPNVVATPSKQPAASTFLWGQINAALFACRKQEVNRTGQILTGGATTQVPSLAVTGQALTPQRWITALADPAQVARLERALGLIAANNHVWRGTTISDSASGKTYVRWDIRLPVGNDLPENPDGVAQVFEEVESHRLWFARLGQVTALGDPP